MFPSCSESKKENNKVPDNFEVGEFASSEVKVQNGNFSTIISEDTTKINSLISFSNYKPTYTKFAYTFIDNSNSEERLTVPGPSDHSLEVVMKFDSSTISQIIKIYQKETEDSLIFKKSDFNFNWLDQDTQKELMNPNTQIKQYKISIWPTLSNPNTFILILNKTILLINRT